VDVLSNFHVGLHSIIAKVLFVVERCIGDCVQSILRVLSTLSLHRICEIAIEIKLMCARCVTFCLQDNMSDLNIRVSSQKVGNTISIGKILPQLATSQKVVLAAASAIYFCWVILCTTDHDIHDNFALIIDHTIQALSDGALRIEIVNGASIHESTHSPGMRRENEGD